MADCGRGKTWGASRRQDQLAKIATWVPVAVSWGLGVPSN